MKLRATLLSATVVLGLFSLALPANAGAGLLQYKDPVGDAGVAGRSRAGRGHLHRLIHLIYKELRNNA